MSSFTDAKNLWAVWELSTNVVFKGALHEGVLHTPNCSLGQASVVLRSLDNIDDLCDQCMSFINLPRYASTSYDLARSYVSLAMVEAELTTCVGPSDTTIVEDLVDTCLVLERIGGIRDEVDLNQVKRPEAFAWFEDVNRRLEQHHTDISRWAVKHRSEVLAYYASNIENTTSGISALVRMLDLDQQFLVRVKISSDALKVMPRAITACIEPVMMLTAKALGVMDDYQAVLDFALIDEDPEAVVYAASRLLADSDALSVASALEMARQL